jgi:hypothetical protein
VDVALRVFDGIDLQAAIQQFQPSLSDKTPSKKGRTKSELPSSVPQNNPASLVLEAIYLKSFSLQKLGKSIGTILYVPFVILILDYLINNVNIF